MKMWQICKFALQIEKNWTWDLPNLATVDKCRQIEQIKRIFEEGLTDLIKCSVINNELKPIHGVKIRQVFVE